jgi:hypothetical protein
MPTVEERTVSDVEIRLDTEERYPDYTIHGKGTVYGVPVTVSSGTLSRWKRVQAEYDRIITEMGEVHQAGVAEHQKREAVRRAEKKVRDAQEALDKLREEQG